MKFVRKAFFVSRSNQLQTLPINIKSINNLLNSLIPLSMPENNQINQQIILKSVPI